jgi:DeoR family transcriptional regulator, suf operon transcriptional repressor
MGASATVSRTTGMRGPLGHKGPRAAILIELKRERRLTANELARKLDASLNAVRHHLKELESEALVEYERERRGVGAPVFAYRLTAAGEALFPQRYESTLLQVLDQLVERDGRDEAVVLLESSFDALARRLEPELAGATESERLDIVTRALADEGYMAEWEGTDEEGALIEHNCAILAVARRFPEICGAEQRFLSRTLGADVERKSHILTGCNACGYAVRFPRRADTEHT